MIQIISQTRVATSYKLYGRSILRSCSLETLKTIARSVWGERHFCSNQDYFTRVQAVAKALQVKARAAGMPQDFNVREFYAAAALTVRAHVYLEDKPEKGQYVGAPRLRKRGDLDVYHMLRILERKAASDRPYIGRSGYLAIWLHDAHEDADLPFETISNVFGTRTAGIVRTLTKFKINRFQSMETKLAEAAAYDPRFIAEVKEFPEAYEIKKDDVDDYFNTTGTDRITPESLYYHFRFVDELLVPIGRMVFGDWAGITELANKAMKIQRPSVFQKYARAAEKALEDPAVQRTLALLQSTVEASGIKARVEIRTLSPYEMHSKELEFQFRRGREQALERQLLSINEIDGSDHTIDEEIGYQTEPLLRLDAEDEFSDGEEPPPSFVWRSDSLVAVDLITANQKDCFRLSDQIVQAAEITCLTGQDFIHRPKLNGYRGLHAKVFVGNDRTTSLKLKIFSAAMQRVNRQGILETLLTENGMRPADSPFLGEEILAAAKGSDRETRTLIFRRLPQVRTLSVNGNAVMAWRYDSLLDVITLTNPALALHFHQAQAEGLRWGTHRMDPRKPIGWPSGLSIQVQASDRYYGFDPLPLASKSVGKITHDSLH